MNPSEMKEALEVDAARRGFYGFLASLYKLELSQDEIDAMAHQRYPMDDPDLGTGYARIAEYLRHRDSGTRQELAVDYAHVFLGAGEYEKRMAPPYESVYTSEEHLLMQDARDGVLVHYRAEDLDLPSENTTPEDHISFEFQFMGKLIERADHALQGGDNARYRDLCAKQQAFFREHLENWVGEFCNDVEHLSGTDFYQGVAQITRGFIHIEHGVLRQLCSAV